MKQTERNEIYQGNPKIDKNLKNHVQSFNTSITKSGFKAKNE